MFELVGIELEYVIVDQERLAVLPVCDRVLAREGLEAPIPSFAESRTLNPEPSVPAEVTFDDVSWSNELALHVIELKVTDPVCTLEGVAGAFDRHIQRVNAHLGALGGCLMPTAVHPWMDPRAEARLWPHEYAEIYALFDRIFDCRSHGWTNLQSVHVNLPFAGDDEFARLHAAIRLLLPLLPALAASSPIIDGRVTGVLDNRLVAYAGHCAAVPSLTGQVIPEPVFTRRAYQERILEPIYRDLQPHDPEGMLRHEWANARGAIARFERDTIEIRLLDMQECPAADVAIVAAVVAVLKLMVAESWSSRSTQKAWPVEPLAAVLQATVRDADAAVISDADYLGVFGWPGAAPCTAGRLWHHLIDAARLRYSDDLAFCEPELGTILDEGPLARRMLRALGSPPSRADLEHLYRGLCEGLAAGAMFTSGR